MIMDESFKWGNISDYMYSIQSKLPQQLTRNDINKMNQYKRECDYVIRENKLSGLTIKTAAYLLQKINKKLEIYYKSKSSKKKQPELFK